MLVAMLALVLALGGTAAAAFEPTKSAVKQIAKKQGKKQADKRLKANVAGSHVNTADNATSLGGSPAADYAKKADVRADGNVSTTTIDDFTSAAFTSLISKDFTAPSSGFLLIIGHVSSEDDVTLAGENKLSARLRLDTTGITDNNGYESSGGAADDNDGNTIGMSAVVPVTAGAHTVHLDAREQGTGSFIENRDISALFVPSGSGVTTLPVPAAAARGNSK